MSKIEIRQARREKIYAKIALMGASGSGKSYSALRIAKGMLSKLKELGLEQNGRIAVINTEQGRGLYYANEFDYDIVDLEPPYTPERYIEYIHEIVKMEYPILIVDSTSHEWDEVLAIQARLGGRYQDWARVTPRHDKFIEAIANTPIHIIATMRGKDQYTMDENQSGKTTVRKLGVGAKQREGFEYEFTATFLLDQSDNLAVAKKDNTHLFEDRNNFLFKEEDGVLIVEWANSGEGKYIAPKKWVEEQQKAEPTKKAPTPTPTKAKETKPKEQKADESNVVGEREGLISAIIALAKEFGGSTNEELMGVMYKYAESGNPNDIESVDELNALYAELSQYKKQ